MFHSEIAKIMQPPVLGMYFSDFPQNTENFKDRDLNVFDQRIKVIIFEMEALIPCTFLSHMLLSTGSVILVLVPLKMERHLTIGIPLHEPSALLLRLH